MGLHLVSKVNKELIHLYKNRGIWQTVWIESVPKTYIKNVKITPRYDEPSVTF